jgi:hypothetical protein
MRSALLACLALVAFAPTLRGALIATDGFESYAAGSQFESGPDGSAGTGLNGGSGFTGAYDTDVLNKSHASVIAQGLNYGAGSVLITGGVNSANFTGPITLATTSSPERSPRKPVRSTLASFSEGRRRRRMRTFFRSAFQAPPRVNLRSRRGSLGR